MGVRWAAQRAPRRIGNHLCELAVGDGNHVSLERLHLLAKLRLPGRMLQEESKPCWILGSRLEQRIHTLRCEIFRTDRDKEPLADAVEHRAVEVGLGHEVPVEDDTADTSLVRYDDVISGLCAAGTAESGPIPEEYVAWLAAMPLFAGHETTVVRIDVGTLLLLTNPEQREMLSRHHERVTNAVEESLRASDTGAGGLPRYAHSDITVGGVTIRTGEAVLLDEGAANHDERVFAQSDRFDINRQPNPHLTFGYGPRFRLGAPLARMELEAVFARLIPRFPTLCLAVPLEQVRVRSDLLTGGLVELPVAW